MIRRRHLAVKPLKHIPIVGQHLSIEHNAAPKTLHRKHKGRVKTTTEDIDAEACRQGAKMASQAHIALFSRASPETQQIHNHAACATGCLLYPGRINLLAEVDQATMKKMPCAFQATIFRRIGLLLRPH